MCTIRTRNFKKLNCLNGGFNINLLFVCSVGLVITDHWLCSFLAVGSYTPSV